MLRSVKQWWYRHKPDSINNYSRGYDDGHRDGEEIFRGRDLFTREQVINIAERYGEVKYNDGKRDGLSIAREQAANSLKEILWQQNQQTRTQK